MSEENEEKKEVEKPQPITVNIIPLIDETIEQLGKVPATCVQDVSAVQDLIAGWRQFKNLIDPPKKEETKQA